MIFHNDSLTIQRPVKVKENGEINYIDELVAENVPCHLSVRALSPTVQSPSTATVLYDFTLFHKTALGLNILPNDKIEVLTAQGQSFHLKAGKSHNYPMTVQTKCEELHIV